MSTGTAGPSNGATPDRDPLEPDMDPALHAGLERWRANVGDPVSLDIAPPAAPRLSGVDVISWNMAIGLGELDRLLTVLRETHAVSASADRPLLVLAQEAFRCGGSVPPAALGAWHGGLAPGAGRLCITDVARKHGLSLRYSPSMRNGAHASDRGNAVLSSAALTAARAHLLPFVRQRRVAVAAALRGHEDIAFVSAHLDTHGRTRPSGRWVGSHGRGEQARALGRLLGELTGTVVLGADLNSVRGMTDRAVRELVTAGLHPARRLGGWRHTFHRPLPLLLDHVMYRCSAGRIRAASVLRIDEAPRDRSPAVFGSDHHPLLARIELDG